MIQTIFLERVPGMGQVLDHRANAPDDVIAVCTKEEWAALGKGHSWSPVYIRSDNGQQVTWNSAPVGSQVLLDDEHYPKGSDGFALVVKCPTNHWWWVDSRASNCTNRSDPIHRCWIRHGDPRKCNVTVDKNGNTCNAGGGSIQTPDWHGFLRNGKLVE